MKWADSRHMKLDDAPVVGILGPCGVLTGVNPFHREGWVLELRLCNGSNLEALGDRYMFGPHEVSLRPCKENNALG